MKYRKLLKIYILHWRLYIFLYLLIGLVIAIPLALKTYINGKINVSYDNYELTTLLSNDILIKSSKNDNPANMYSLDGNIVNGLKDTIRELGFEERVVFLTHSMLNIITCDTDINYYIAAQIDEPGYFLPIVLSENIPSGYFSYNLYDKDVPETFTLVSPLYSKARELKRLEQPINYPLSYKYKYAINTYDAKALKIHALQHVSDAAVLDFREESFRNFDVHAITLNISALSKDEGRVLINKLKSFREIKVMVHGDYEENIVDGLIFIELRDLYIIDRNLRTSITYISVVLSYIALCALLVLSIQIYETRRREYQDFKRLGLSKASYILLRISEDMLSIIIATIFAFIILLASKIIVYNFQPPDLNITLSNNIFEYEIHYSDIFTMNDRYVFNIPYLSVIKESLIYFGILIVIDALVEFIKRRKKT